MFSRIYTSNRYARRPEGMALILAMVIAAIILTLGLNITNITAKEIYLASFSGGSDMALYEADSALECAEYYNGGITPVFARTGGSDTGGALSCLGNTIQGTNRVQPASTDDPAVTTFWIPGTTPPAEYTGSGPCAFVSVSNRTDTTNPSVIHATYSIDGYNTCDSNNPRRVQRSLQVNATLSS